MFDPKALLDQVLSGSARSGGAGGARGAGTGDLQQMLGKVLGGGGLAGLGGGQDRAPGQSAGFGKQLGGLPGGAVAGGLVALLLGSKSGRKLGGSAIKIGGLALLGGLAYKAWSDWQANAKPGQSVQAAPESAALPPPSQTPFAVAGDAAHADTSSETLLRFMIAAARADGRIDAQEQAALREAFHQGGADQDVENFLFEALGRADDLDALVARVHTPEFAAEAYLAARLVAEPDTPAERDFLDRLSTKLRLDPGLVAHLEATAVSAKAGETVA